MVNGLWRLKRINMKDHRKAEIVNEITALAKKFAETQQLREHMRGAVLAYLEEQDRDTRHEVFSELSSLVQDYYKAVIATAECPDLISSTGRTDKASELMQKMYDAQSKMFAAVGIDYHGNKI